MKNVFYVNSSQQHLGYSAEDIERAKQTLQHLASYLQCEYVLVGGLVNRSLFPEWASTLPKKRMNDLDIVVPRGAQFLSPAAHTDFHITHIYSDGENNYYFAIVDKKTWVKVDVFPWKREIETEILYIDDERYIVRTISEILLKAARDIYVFLTTASPLEPKHIDLFRYLHDELHVAVPEHLWRLEFEIIEQDSDYPFKTFMEYVEQIERLILDPKRQHLIAVKERWGYKEYPIDCVEVDGMRIVDEQLFRDIAEKIYAP